MNEETENEANNAHESLSGNELMDNANAAAEELLHWSQHLAQKAAQEGKDINISSMSLLGTATWVVMGVLGVNAQRALDEVHVEDLFKRGNDNKEHTK